MKFAKTLAVIGGTLLATTAVLAQDPVAQRKEAMKAVGAATGPLGRMLRGEEGFDLAKVQAALNVYSRTAKVAPAMFPAGSDQGDTKVQPAAFAEKDKFNGFFASWDQAATTALTTIKDEASFKTEMPKVLASCGACHTPYRKPLQ
jgi:cytochrome c556